MRTEKIISVNFKSFPDGTFSHQELMSDEIEGVNMEILTMNGPFQYKTASSEESYEVLLSLRGEGLINAEGKTCATKGIFVTRIPYATGYTLSTPFGKGVQYLRIKKLLDKSDKESIYKNRTAHSGLYAKALTECPTYTEDIKSSKTENRMILPEGMVPRFCMGAVKTEGADHVDKHRHPMLDQIFLGLEECKCMCDADGDKALLEENMILHIPLGSNHSVSVKQGDTLFYIWMDFFLTIDGEKYMDQQHHIDSTQNK